MRGANTLLQWSAGTGGWRVSWSRALGYDWDEVHSEAEILDGNLNGRSVGP